MLCPAYFLTFVATELKTPKPSVKSFTDRRRYRTTHKQKNKQENQKSKLRQRFRHLSQRVRPEGRRQHGVILDPRPPLRRHASQENNRVEGHPAYSYHDRESDELLLFRRNVRGGRGGPR